MYPKQHCYKYFMKNILTGVVEGALYFNIQIFSSTITDWTGTN